MATTEMQERPWHLRGNYGPVEQELEVHELEIEGEVPVELEGSYYRNGFNPPSGWSDHWFFGTGMIHQVELGGGTALTYRNRYVRTPYFDRSPDLFTAMMDPLMSPANTNIIRHAGKLLALEEVHRAWEVTADLDTVGCYDFDGRFEGQTMTAHPKICPETGELIFFGYQMREPFLTYYRADASGALVQSEEIDLGRGIMMHDFNITRNFVVFMDLPIVAGETGPQYRPETGARLGVMPRNGTNADVRWYEIAPCTVFHPLNAYDEGTKIVMDVCKQEHGQMRGGMNDLTGEPARLWRWTIDTKTGRVTDEMIDERFADFPKVDDRFAGLKSRYGFAASFEDAGAPELGSEVIKYDLHEMKSETHHLGTHCKGQEPVFVPRSPDSPEGEGFVLVLSYDEAESRSALVILDAENFSAAPIARVELPQRVPYGAHGNWMSKESAAH